MSRSRSSARSYCRLPITDYPFCLNHGFKGITRIARIVIKLECVSLIREQLSQFAGGKRPFRPFCGCKLLAIGCRPEFEFILNYYYQWLYNNMKLEIVMFFIKIMMRWFPPFESDRRRKPVSMTFLRKWNETQFHDIGTKFSRNNFKLPRHKNSGSDR